MIRRLLRWIVRPRVPFRETEEPDALHLFPCWFCKTPVPVSFLIAGYDTWDEQRLACLDCDTEMRAA